MYTIPNRINKVDDLVRNLALIGNQWGEKGIDQDPEDINATLAFCEVAVSLPASWFAEQERLLITIIVETVFPDGFLAFVAAVNSGELSFYAKCREESQMDKEQLLAWIHARHNERFGC